MGYIGRKTGVLLKMKQKEKKEEGFVQEKTKMKPINKKKLLQKMLVSVCLAVVFGVVASVSFVFVTPWIQTLHTTKPTSKIDLDGNQQKDSTVNLPGITDISQNPTSGIKIEDLQRLSYNLFTIGGNSNGGIVTVRGTGESSVKDEQSSFDMDDTSGIIIAKSETEILILAQHGTVRSGGSYHVLFSSGENVSASVKGYDSKTNIAILSVPLKEVSSNTQKSIRVIELGNTKAIARGKYAIAVGNPLGDNYSVQVGIIEATNFSVSYVDGVISLLSTNLLAKTKSGGFLIDDESRLIGIITHDADNAKEANTIQAMAISDVTPILNRMVNSQKIPYIGVRISTITERIAKENDMPEGVYVESVILDSPAMSTAIQKGDIIQEVGKNPVKTARQFHEIMSSYEAGSTISVSLKRYSSTGYKTVLCYVTLGTLSETK